MHQNILLPFLCPEVIAIIYSASVILLSICMHPAHAGVCRSICRHMCGHMCKSVHENRQENDTNSFIFSDLLLALIFDLPPNYGLRPLTLDALLLTPDSWPLTPDQINRCRTISVRVRKKTWLKWFTKFTNLRTRAPWKHLISSLIENWECPRNKWINNHKLIDKIQS